MSSLSDYHLTLTALYWFYNAHITSDAVKLNFLSGWRGICALLYTFHRFTFDILHSALWDLYRGRLNIHQGFMNPNKIIFCSVFQMVRAKNHPIVALTVSIDLLFSCGLFPWHPFKTLKTGLQPKPLHGWRKQMKPGAYSYSTNVKKCWMHFLVWLVQTLWMIALIAASNVHWYVPCEPRIT